MPFLALNGTTFRIQSDGIGQKYNEHGVDRFRTFDGSMRVTRRGIYREWNGNTAILTYADAATLIALLTGAAVPLALTGDLVGEEEVAVMPVLISNDPMNTAQGQRRRVVFTLHETPTALPPDTTADVWSFIQRATGQFQELDGTVAAASDGDPLGYWTDQSGFGRHWLAQQTVGPDTRPALLNGAAQFTGGTPWLKVPTGFHLLESAEIMMRLKTEDDPPLSGEDLRCRLHNMGAVSGGASAFYPKLDGHIWDAFGGSTLYDIGDATDDLTEWNIANAFSDPTDGYAYRLNDVVLFSKTIAAGHVVDFGVGSTAFTFGGALPNVNNSWFGVLSDLLIVEGEMTIAQRRSWYDYFSGAVEDPPLPE